MLFGALGTKYISSVNLSNPLLSSSSVGQTYSFTFAQVVCYHLRSFAILHFHSKVKKLKCWIYRHGRRSIVFKVSNDVVHKSFLLKANDRREIILVQLILGSQKMTPINNFFKSNFVICICLYFWIHQLHRFDLVGFLNSYSICKSFRIVFSLTYCWLEFIINL